MQRLKAYHHNMRLSILGTYEKPKADKRLTDYSQASGRADVYFCRRDQILDRASDDAGIAREQVYITNALKHFKFEPRGKRRIHS
jgi:hypothetical protein